MFVVFLLKSRKKKSKRAFVFTNFQTFAIVSSRTSGPERMFRGARSQSFCPPSLIHLGIAKEIFYRSLRCKSPESYITGPTLNQNGGNRQITKPHQRGQGDACIVSISTRLCKTKRLFFKFNFY